jgi:hypothetical protein
MFREMYIRRHVQVYLLMNQISNDQRLICDLCHKKFSRAYTLKIHINTIHNPNRPIKEGSYTCSICHKAFARLYNLQKHQKTVHHMDIPSAPTYDELVTKIHELKEDRESLKDEVHQEFKKLTEKIEKIGQNNVSQTNNLVFRVICLTSNDNYLDLLTDRLGDFEQAIDYIKNCALSEVVGDCKLIEKIYQTQEKELPFTTNKKRTLIYYRDKENQLVTESKEVFGRKLANNLQNSYLKSVNYLITRNLENKTDPNKFLAEYDILSWNKHIYSLSDITYQKKMVNHLNLMVKK